MSTNVIMRAAHNRPEMLQVSIEHEIKAREYYMLPGKFITLFVVDFGASEEVFKVIDKYPYEKKVIVRQQRLGLTVNILEGMKEAFNLADDFIVYDEEDICLHESYFKYMDLMLNMDVGKFSVLSAFNHNDSGDTHAIYKAHHYCAWGSLIPKDFYLTYIYPCSTPGYYANRNGFMLELNKNYQDYVESGKYKYKNATHNEQAGMINRLVDIAMIEEERFVIMPRVNRQQHIGFYGSNRGGNLNGSTFEQRLEDMRNIMENNTFFERTGSKCYDDYKTFSPKLDSWDGTLYLEGA